MQTKGLGMQTGSEWKKGVLGGVLREPFRYLKCSPEGDGGFLGQRGRCVGCGAAKCVGMSHAVPSISGIVAAANGSSPCWSTN